MVAQSIAYGISGIFGALGMLTLWAWWSSSDSDPKAFWASVMYLVFAYTVAWVGGI